MGLPKAPSEFDVTPFFSKKLIWKLAPLVGQFNRHEVKMKEMDVFKVYEIIDKYIDYDALWKKTVGFYDCEKHLGLCHWEKSAIFGINEFKKAGIKTNVLKIPADGKTVALDHIMPMGWDCSFAKLELVDNGGKSERLVDSFTEPLCIGLFSKPTPKEGIVAEIVRDHTYGRTPWKNKFIFSTQNVDGAKELRKKINDTGAFGLISAWNDLYFEAPDSHKFLNTFTSTPGWYPPADEPPTIVFSVSPRQGKRIADRLARGRCCVRATVHGKLGKDTLLAVSGSIQGKCPAMPEVLGIAHMYEPFPTDDASGCASAIEILSAIKRAIENKELSQPKRTINMLLTWERYGLAYYYDKFRRKKRFLTAVNLDNAGEAYREEPIKIFHSSAVLPWGGDYSWLALCGKILTEKFAKRYQYKEIRGNCGDDCLLSQPAYGVPTMWILNTSSSGRGHHNTSITLDKIDPELFRSSTSISGAYLYLMAYAGELEARSWAEGIAHKASYYIDNAIRNKTMDCEKAEFETDYYARQVESLLKIEERPSPDYEHYLETKAFQIRKLAPKYTRKTIVTRMTKRAKNYTVSLKDPACLPNDQARVPVTKRQECYYCNALLNWCDGKRDLAEALRFLSLETSRKFNDKQIGRFFKALNILAKAGYVKLKKSTVLAEKDLVSASKKGGNTKR